MDKCKGCQWYNKPYWSVVSPCNSCYKDEEISVYISSKGYGKSYYELQQRIDKAIEYMNNTFDIRDVKDLFKAFDDVENILRGKDND